MKTNTINPPCWHRWTGFCYQGEICNDLIGEHGQESEHGSEGHQVHEQQRITSTIPSIRKMTTTKTTTTKRR